MTTSARFHLTPARRYRLALFPLALILRLGNWVGVFTPVGVFPEGPDSYLHLRRILAAVSHFPFVPGTDRYLNFPEGGHTYWPYGFDIFYAAVIKLLTLGMADDWWATAIASLVTPVVGALIPMIAFTIAEELGDWRAGLLAGVMAAFLEPLVLQATVGIIDHHVFEAFFLGLYLLALARMAKRASDPDARPDSFRGVAVGMALVGGLLFTTVFPFVLGLHLGMTALLPLVVRGEARGRLLDALVRSWWATAGGLVPFVAFRFFEPEGVNPSLTIGWMVAAAGLLGGSVARSAVRGGTVPFLGQAMIGAVAFVLVVGLLLDYQPVNSYAAYGNRFVFSSDPIIQGIKETAPLWRSGLVGVLRVGTGLVLLYPVAVGWLTWRGLRGNAALLALALTSLALEAMGINQLRFLNFAAVPFVAVLGVAVFLGVDEIRRRERLSEGRLRLALTGLLIVAALPSYLMLLYIQQPRVVSTDGRFVELFPTLQWIADRTPRTTPGGNAPDDYSITARWDLGHWLVQISKRPCLGSPLTFPWHQRGIREGAVIFFEPPDRALELMRKRRARYILVTPLSLTHFFTLSRWDIPSNTVAPVSETEKQSLIQNGLYTQLLVGLGIPAGSSSPAGLRHFRLVHESQDLRFPGMQRPFAMLFEAVPGAVVRGRATPGATIAVAGQIRAGGGRTFEYADSVTADAGGRFEVTLPYASGPQRYSDIDALEGFTLKSGGASATVAVSENDVLTGRVLDLGALPTGGK